ncbi:MAG: adenylate kinase [Janthinobacterium lividum]
MNLSRTIILGNSGSGKSWLAERLARHLGVSCIDLDFIYWLPGGFSAARDRGEAVQMLRQASTTARWMVEGIYGSLIDEILPDATALVWLCLDEAQCVANIRQRGMRRNATREAFAALLDWAQTYSTRQGSSSFSGHAAIFENFAGEKKILRSRSAVTAFAAQFYKPTRM